MTLKESQQTGGNYGSRSFALVDRYTPPDHPSHLGVRWASLMTAPIQFIVLKYKGKWSIKSRDLQRSFSMQREAMDAAIQLANEAGKEGKPAVVLFQKSKTEFPYPPVRSDLPATSGSPEPPKLQTPPVKAITLARTDSRRKQSLFFLVGQL
jgi:hypothetical protein